MATNERDEAAYKEFLEDKVAAQEAEIAGLKAQINELKKQRGISSARDGLTFDEHTGVWADQAGRLYCSSCLDQDKRNPMKTELPWGWRCSAQPKHYFSNPDAPDPNAQIG